MRRILAPCVFLLLGSIAAPQFAQSGPGKDADCSTCKKAPTVATTFAQEFEKLQQEMLAESLRVAEAVPEKDYAWKPSQESPSVLEVLKKITEQNYRTARLLRQPAGTATAKSKKEAKEQVRSAFQAVSRGVAAFPPGTDPGKIHLDMQNVQSSLREFMMRHLAVTSQLLGELKARAQLASERKAAG